MWVKCTWFEFRGTLRPKPQLKAKLIFLHFILFSFVRFWFNFVVLHFSLLIALSLLHWFYRIFGCRATEYNTYLSTKAKAEYMRSVVVTSNSSQQHSSMTPSNDETKTWKWNIWVLRCIFSGNDELNFNAILILVGASIYFPSTSLQGSISDMDENDTKMQASSSRILKVDRAYKYQCDRPKIDEHNYV